MSTTRHAFTLIQLAVGVVALMGLIALAIPALQHQVAMGYAVKCRDNLAQIHRGLIAYRNENDRWWPETRIPTQAGEVKEFNPWVELVADHRYVASLDAFVCPADVNAPRRAAVTAEFFARAVAAAPSYGLNELTWREYGVSATEDPGLRRTPSRQDLTILLADLGPDLPMSDMAADDVELRAAVEFGRDGGRLTAADGFRPGAGRQVGHWLVQRHGRAINLMAMVGSATAVACDVTERMGRIPERYYDDCATGTGDARCTYCNVFKAPHYDFSRERLYFWTGPYYDTAAMLAPDPR